MIALLLILPAILTLKAYPPAPYHTLYGMVRNQFGNPLNITGAEVFLLSDSSSTLVASMVPGLQPGMNYQMNVPMDSGVAPDLYTPTAMRPLLPFQLQVRLGQLTYLPIEMNGSLAQIGEPGGSTRIDLTLGVDSDGDGLPDAWEQELIDALGGTLTLADIGPGGDEDADGLNNLGEYLAGTYAYDPQDGFELRLLASQPQAATLEFLVIRGRSYTIESSLDLKVWQPVSFRPLTQPDLIQRFNATDSRVLRFEVPSVDGGETNLFFRAMVQ